MSTIQSTVILSCNDQPQTLRQRLAHHLRHMAQRLDGRWTLAIYLETVPRLGEKERSEIIRAGVHHMGLLADLLVDMEADEWVLRNSAPWLFKDHP